ncbi:NAD(+) kinase [Desulfurispirillum indicum S5]|uniref:NAD kinase n=1 Tax=Desulfurispirillum indicum (strain ATCC BAA-1389 / DSM 22839 / S5) TaxID=653733 RepID=E6W522_DESIS|nr:NAD(+)/NADH kinase [Desulfurispirillum indicum]ADU65998.1 NAD(+) kinase [Desulfurispirillum indicum S5]
METIKYVGIIGKPKQELTRTVVSELIAFLESQGIRYDLDEDTARTCNMEKWVNKSQLVNEVDLLVALGGDGTILGVARLMAATSIPILAVNLGRLGFLTEVTVDQLFPVLAEILKGNYRVDNRMMLNAHVHRRGERFGTHNVLNDVVINKGALARIIELELFVNDQFVTRYRSDGLIVSTPTGSTAYNLAANGPIIHPSLTNMIITPICPHMLTNRSIVIPADGVHLSIRVKSHSSDVMLTLDGQVGVGLQTDDIIHIAKSDAVIRMITHPKKNYYAILKEKMKWAEL